MEGNTACLRRMMLPTPPIPLGPGSHRGDGVLVDDDESFARAVAAMENGLRERKVKRISTTEDCLSARQGLDVLIDDDESFARAVAAMDNGLRERRVKKTSTKEVCLTADIAMVPQGKLKLPVVCFQGQDKGKNPTPEDATEDSGGASICQHGRRRSRCKKSGEASSEHVRQRSTFTEECGGTSICEHGRIRSTCKECRGSSICEHGRQRSQCK